MRKLFTRMAIIKFFTTLIFFVIFSLPLGASGIRIGLVLPELSNAAINDIAIGAKKRANEIGNIEILLTGTYSGEEQAKAVENYIAAGVDLIAYDSIDAAAVGPAIVKANKANIPVIGVISAASSGEMVTFITPDFCENGRLIGSWMSKTLGRNGIVSHVEGNPADAAGACLTKGFLAGLKENGIQGTVSQAPSNWARQKGMQVAENMLTSRPDLQGIYGANDDVAMGVLQAVRAAGRLGDVLVAGHNGTCEALASMLKGDLDFTVLLFNQPLGALMIDKAVDVLNGKKIPDFLGAPVLGLDAVWAKQIVAGTRDGLPGNIAQEVKDRLKAASAGCK